ncbi:glycosyltransferase family 4 protein [[Candida] arabinofermentans NRRL YB-2248]|uniref:Alpha-1,3/1,6-mannosyltransferase ALG2 n=1 Tax=[Candida] arabinofermentans NRRL YB-2248 TaxID=983967 RepID=A0A1E4T7Q2_9ASCO|nr:glycosyltransferase family 4 protein [[Candida] arabinofermentans NRRL YB-2248]
MSSQTRKPLKIAFLHPDLGIGGAERLIVDAALSLKSQDLHDITIYTSHCDKSHCFEEVARGDLKVVVYGDFLPTSFLGKFSIIFAFLRQFYLTIILISSGLLRQYDLIILDQLPYCIPLLHYFKSAQAKVLFYCHFPDKLLASHSNIIRKTYRWAFDKLEEFSTSCADKVVVNSNFTRLVVQRTFPKLRNQELSIVYPCVSSELTIPETTISDVNSFFKNNTSFFLSINRFERKKNIQLAIKSYAKYIKDTNDLTQKLVIAGGYDARVFENVSYLIELEKLCDSLNLKSLTIRGKLSISPNNINVYFMPSISTDLKNALIQKCDLLMYTPRFEHFGIVPLEAMRLGKLVLADNTGGPLETIVSYFNDDQNYTGFTVENTVDNWSDVLEIVKSFNDVELENISQRCKDRINKHFSFDAMTLNLNEIVSSFETKVFPYERLINWIPFSIGFVYILSTLCQYSTNK